MSRKRTALSALLSAALLLLVGSPAMAQSAVVSRGEPICRQVALTFDAGATSESAAGILEALAQHRARSTFFLTGQWTDNDPALATAVASAGHELGNHTDTHPHMPTVSPARMRSELTTAEAKIRTATGIDPRPLWRPPYGEYNGTVLQVAGDAGYAWTVMWDIDTLDWQQPPAQTIVDRVLSRVRAGSIVLMHLGGINTAEAVRRMLPELERRGYMIVTVGEALGLTRTGADFGGRTVYVQPGDTLSAIAACFNTTYPVLAAANDIAEPNRIVPGQRLYVPLFDEVTLRVDGVKLDLATPARIVNGRATAHVRALAEALGAAVSWNGPTQTVSIVRAGTTVELIIGSTAARVNGEPRTLDAAPYLENGRTQVPVRFVAEALGASVGWDATSRTVLVTSD